MDTHKQAAAPHHLRELTLSQVKFNNQKSMPSCLAIHSGEYYFGHDVDLHVRGLQQPQIPASAVIGHPKLGLYERFWTRNGHEIMHMKAVLGGADDDANQKGLTEVGSCCDLLFQGLTDGRCRPFRNTLRISSATSRNSSSHRTRSTSRQTNCHDYRFMPACACLRCGLLLRGDECRQRRSVLV